MKKSKYTVKMMRDALMESSGNITRAAVALGMTKTHAMRLVKKFKVRTFARDQRLAAGNSATGKPIYA